MKKLKPELRAEGARILRQMRRNRDACSGEIREHYRKLIHYMWAAINTAKAVS